MFGDEERSALLILVALLQFQCSTVFFSKRLKSSGWCIDDIGTKIEEEVNNFLLFF